MFIFYYMKKRTVQIEVESRKYSEGNRKRTSLELEFFHGYYTGFLVLRAAAESFLVHHHCQHSHFIKTYISYPIEIICAEAMKCGRYLQRAVAKNHELCQK